MEYTAMKKLIENQNKKLTIGQVTQEEYDSWKTKQLDKLGIFLSMDRITSEQYEELVGILNHNESGDESNQKVQSDINI
jgi:hypothetical protein